MLKGECRKDKFLFEYDYPDHFTKCFWQKKSNILPIWLVYRLILFLYFLATFPYMVFARPEEGYFWYLNIAYYSYWSYFLELLVFGISFGITAARYMKEKKNPRLRQLEEMPWQYKILWVLYNVSAPTSIVVTVIFWLFAYSPRVHTNVAFHLLLGVFNSVILIFDFILWGIPYRFLHFYISILFAFVYTIFTVVYQLGGGPGPNGKPTLYNIVDWRKPGSTMTTVAVLMLSHFLFHCAMCVLHLIKIWMRKTRED